MRGRRWEPIEINSEEYGQHHNAYTAYRTNESAYRYLLWW